MNARLGANLRASLIAALFLVPITASNVDASQGSGCMPTTGTVSGLTFAQDVNAGLAALISSNSGGAPPATDCTGAAVKGQVWLDTSSTPNILKQYDGVNWVVLGFLDTANSVWTPPVGGGVATIASASTTDLWSVSQASVTVSGTTTITAFANASAVPGTMKIIKFASVLTLTHNATSLVLPGGENLTTAAGDYALVVATSDTHVAVASYFKADGTAVINPSADLGDAKFNFAATVPAKWVYGYGQALTRSSYPDYTAAMTKTVSAVRVSGNSTLTSIADTFGLGAGMPIEGTGIQAGTTISSVTSTTIVMSQAASSSGTSDVSIIIPGYGSGGSISTIGVPDCRGRTLAGLDSMGGTAASRITTAGSSINGAQLNAAGGAQTRTIAKENLPNYNLTVTDPGHSHTYTQPQFVAGSSVSSASPVPYDIITPTTSTSTAVTNITVNSGGSGTALATISPTLMANCIVRVLK